MSAREANQDFRNALAVRRAMHLLNKAIDQMQFANESLIAANGAFAPQVLWADSVIHNAIQLADGLQIVSKEYPLC